MTPEPDAADRTATILADFEDGYGFPLDPFQARAVDALRRGRSVLVAAPTGAGKTVVGEFACHLALQTAGKCFYTTPIKALSNQKYRDLVERHGEDAVGLLTGDRSVNGEAPVVVMTTEVLRNMIYEGSTTLRGLQCVVLDEVHYLADRARGAVWEEVIIQLRPAVQIAALSATVSNAEEFGDWLAEVRGGRSSVDVVIEEQRPVPLQHHYYVNDTVHDTFVSKRSGQEHRNSRERARQALAGVPNPRVLMLERQTQQRNRVTNRGRRLPPSVRLRWPDRATVVEELRHRRWLPAIMFVFSRQGCEDAVGQLLDAGVRLTSREERRAIGAIIDRVVGGIPDDDLEVLGYARWREALTNGLAAHHAGLIPAFKEAAEQAFQAGLLRVVVATETLALGINMPAKSVVIERLEKWNGERHVLLSPGEYTQLTGRAGRRGIDPVGHAVVLYQRDIDFRTVAGLVGTRTYPLTSSFEPSYNMAVNLLRRHDLESAERLLTASFAQFQTDASVAGMAKRVDELDRAFDGYRQHLACDRGDWPAYWALRRELSQREKREKKQRRAARDTEVRDAIARLIPGEVVVWPGAPRRALAAVIGTSVTRGGTVLARVVTEDRRVSRLGPRDVDAPPPVVGEIPLPGGHHRQPAYRAQVAGRLRELPDPPVPSEPAVEPVPPSERIEELRRLIREHPSHDCPEREEHERWQYRADEVGDEADGLRHHIEQRTGSLVRQLHRLLEVLRDLGYVDEVPAPTEEGLRLAGIYGDVDLVIAECLRAGVFDGLDAPEVAGLCALFVYESRTDEPPGEPDAPTEVLDAAAHRALVVAEHVHRREEGAGLRPLRPLDPGFIAAAWRWASGDDLDDAIGNLELTGGDFVRNAKQVADLAGQLRDVASPSVAESARRAVDLLRRGVVEA